MKYEAILHVDGVYIQLQLTEFLLGGLVTSVGGAGRNEIDTGYLEFQIFLGVGAWEERLSRGREPTHTHTHTRDAVEKESLGFEFGVFFGEFHCLLIQRFLFFLGFLFDVAFLRRCRVFNCFADFSVCAGWLLLLFDPLFESLSRSGVWDKLLQLVRR